jgi:DNA-binding response OmpR family regulator
MRERILIVDDDQAMRDMLKTFLEKQGYRVILASDGLEGLQQAESEDPDLIILDARMPGLNGAQICRRLRSQERTRSIPIILATGFGDVLLEVLDAGVDDFVMKPVRLAEFLVRVRGMLKVRHIGDEVERAMAYTQEIRRALLPRQCEAGRSTTNLSRSA